MPAGPDFGYRPASPREIRRLRARQRRILRLARTFAVAVTVIVVVAVLASHGGSSPSKSSASNTGSTSASSRGSGAGGSAAVLPAGGPFPVGEQTVTLSDASRTVYLPGGKASPRTLVTTFLYPAVPGTGTASKSPVATVYTGAKPYTRAGPYPLVVFAPGFRQVPSTYFVLLANWAKAGYVVAGVTFPLTNPDAPGGPDESDLANQPADLSFVVNQVSRQAGSAAGAPGAAGSAGAGSASSAVSAGSTATTGSPVSPVSAVAGSGDSAAFLAGLVDPTRVVVAGHSDGGDTVMAAAFNTCCRIPNLKGAIVLSGAELNEPRGTYFPAGSPPLLAVQGSADTVNRPAFTQSLLNDDRTGAKYSLSLDGAGALDAYSTSGNYEQIVAKVTLDFLDAYLEGSQTSLSAITSDGTVAGVSTLQATSPTASTTGSAAGGTTSTSTTPATPPSSTSGTGASVASTSTSVFIPTQSP